MIKNAFEKEKLLNGAQATTETRLDHFVTLDDIKNWINDNNSDTLWILKGKYENNLLEILKKENYICVEDIDFLIVSVLCDVCGEKLSDHIFDKKYIKCN